MKYKFLSQIQLPKLLLGLVLVSSLTIGGSTCLGDYRPKEYLVTMRIPVTFNQSELYKNVPVLPEFLYAKTWELVNDEFYDESFNGESWIYWKNKYQGKLSTLEDAHKAIETALFSLGDRYSRFLDEEQFNDENSQIKAKLCGIGVQISKNADQYLYIISPLEHSPAQKAGLKSGDEIVSINDIDAKGMSIPQAAKLIKGLASTKVSLGILRGKDVLKFMVERAEIPIKVVSAVKMLDNRIGYIRLNSFLSSNAYEEVKNAVLKLNNAQGIILDLRDNPGGLLNNAINISSLFLNTGNIVSTVDRHGYKSTAPCNGKPIFDKPLVILVNHGSASASEITSAALKENKRAKLIGETTYGKGLVQGVYHLLDGSGVNITIARYLTPNGTDINKVGIKPDEVVNLTYKDYQNHLGPWWTSLQESVNIDKSKTNDLQLKIAVESLKKSINQKNKG